MFNRKTLGRILGMAGCVVLGLGVTGCDYWPPTLQSQIEQLQSDVQAVTAENMQLQSQVNELSAANQDLQVRFNEVNRVNQEKSHVIASLHSQVDSLRAKAKKTTARVKKTAKPKSSSKRTVKKKTATKR